MRECGPVFGAAASSSVVAAARARLQPWNGTREVHQPHRLSVRSWSGNLAARAVHQARPRHALCGHNSGTAFQSLLIIAFAAKHPYRLYCSCYPVALLWIRARARLHNSSVRPVRRTIFVSHESPPNNSLDRTTPGLLLPTFNQGLLLTRQCFYPTGGAPARESRLLTGYKITLYWSINIWALLPTLTLLTSCKGFALQSNAHKLPNLGIQKKYKFQSCIRRKH